jgi:hypothetical protein
MRKEYIESLKAGTRILCQSVREKNAILQALKEAGETVSSYTLGDTISAKTLTCPWVGFDSASEYWCGWSRNTVAEVPASEFLLDIWQPPKVTVVKLNKDYEATFCSGTDHVIVGCQKIPTAAIEELYKVIKEP